MGSSDFQKEIEQLIINQLIDYLTVHFRENPNDLPYFPPVIIELIEALQEENVSMNKVESIVQKDSTLALQLLSASNSVLYNGLEEQHSIQGALVRLGFQETHNIAMHVAFQTFFHKKASMIHKMFQRVREEFFDYTLLTAYGSRLLGQVLNLGYGEILFLGGLFHDIGKILILHALASGKAYEKFQIEVSESYLFHLFEELHVDLGVEFLSKNRIAKPIIQIASEHHETNLLSESSNIFTHIIRVASFIAYELHFYPLAKFYDAEQLEKEYLVSRTALKIDSRAISEYRREFMKIALHVLDVRTRLEQEAEKKVIEPTASSEKPAKKTWVK